MQLQPSQQGEYCLLTTHATVTRIAPACRYVAADLYGLAVDALGLSRPNPPEWEHFKQAAAIRNPAALAIGAPRAATITFASIAGLDGIFFAVYIVHFYPCCADVVATLRAAILMPLCSDSQAAFERLGVQPPRGVMLYGPPGEAQFCP